jgi:hypothetical protein
MFNQRGGDCLNFEQERCAAINDQQALGRRFALLLTRRRSTFI